MPTEGKCPQCGAVLAQGALAGLCPACLLAQGAAIETETQPGAQFQPPTVEEVAKLFPQLQVLAFIGKGGMGAVYQARQPALDRVVALKILPSRLAGGPEFAGRFNREARALAKLNHPNIVAVYEFGQAEGMPFFIMEFVDGLNLRQLERAGKLSSREALQIVPQICEALQFAHDEGIVHRDIKPENILLDKKGRVKIADFGIAKLMGTGSLMPDPGAHGVTRPTDALTEAGKTVGTPQYMAPEQVQNPQEVDHRADIYSLGVVFYEMLTGELPLGKFAPPSRKVVVDVRLDEVVLRALEKEPEHRYQHASQVKTAVETIATSPQSAAAAASFHGRAWNRAQQFEYRSKATLFGLPLVHVALGVDPQTGRGLVAKGIVAIGGRAKGVFAFGGMAQGVFAFGGLAIGVFANGGCALGLVSLGGLAVALLLALGGGAIAPIAVGGGAIGIYAIGGGALGVHALSPMAQDPAAENLFSTWGGFLFTKVPEIAAVMMVFVMGIGLGVPLILQLRQRGQQKLLGMAALGFAGLSGVLGIVAFCLFPHPPAILVWAIIGAALVGISLGLGSRDTRPGRSAIAVGCVNTGIWIVVFTICQFIGSGLPSFYIGQANFPRGDSIEITSVQRNDERIVVKGHYNLVSEDSATLALYISSTNGVGVNGPLGPQQKMRISSGQGSFELTHPDVVPGLPHVSMYGADGEGFADLYFGTKEEAEAEGKIKFRASQAQGGAATTHDAVANGPDTKTIVLTRTTNQLIGASSDVRTVMVFTDTTVFPGEVLQARQRLPDGQLTDAPGSLHVNRTANGRGTSCSFSWFFKTPFTEEDAAAAVIEISRNHAERPVVLTIGQPLALFSVTNKLGGVLSGFIEYKRVAPNPPIPKSESDAKARATVRLHPFGAVLTYYSGTVPQGYTLQATANWAENHNGSAYTMSPSGPYDYHSSWMLPLRSFVEEQQSVGNQLKRLADSGPIQITFGEPQLLFSVTNKSGEVFQGMLELVGPPDAANK
jgi:predicted Ser/Thr protein kinase